MDSQGIEKVHSEKEVAGYEEYLLLHIKIQFTEGIDDGEFLDIIKNKIPNKNHGDMRLYRAFGGIGRGLEFCTPPQQGFPDPSWIPWNMTNTLPLIKDLDCKYLYVEVMKHWSMQDPGTSTGNRIVGRAAIPIPKQLNQVIRGRYGLVRKTEHGVIANGHISVAMELKKIGMSCDADYNDNNNNNDSSSDDDNTDSSSDDQEI